MQNDKSPERGISIVAGFCVALLYFVVGVRVIPFSKAQGGDMDFAGLLGLIELVAFLVSSIVVWVIVVFLIRKRPNTNNGRRE